MNKEQTFLEKLEEVFSENLILIIVLFILLLTCVIFYYLDWWDAIGLLILNLGLGMKLHGAKTFAMAVAKSGGKKALAMTTAGVIIKRHIIDLMTKFFAEHSVKRYKDNILRIAKLQFEKIKNSSPAQKMKAVVGSVLSIPIVYFIWSKVLGTAIQKFIYALVYPIIVWLFDFITHGFNLITNLIGFVFQLTLLNYVINWLEKRPFGRAMLNWVQTLFTILGNVLDFLNDGFKLIGLDPKHRLIVWSNRFNRWLEKIIQKEMNAYDSLWSRRAMHYTSREVLYIHRKARKESLKKVSIKKKFKAFYEKKVLKKKGWREAREERINKRLERQTKTKRPKKKKISKASAWDRANQGLI